MLAEISILGFSAFFDAGSRPQYGVDAEALTVVEVTQSQFGPRMNANPRE
jgi:hypothetical protein